MPDTVVSAVIARLESAFPDWTNTTGNAHPTPQASLPAFAVRVTLSDGERVAMDEPEEWRSGQVEVGLEMQTPADTESGLYAQARLFASAILAPPRDLGGVVWEITKGAFEAEHTSGETGISRGDLIMPVVVLD